MKTTIALSMAAAALAACVPTRSAPVEIPLGAGYRDPADRCRMAGESASTLRYLDDAADLVACPEGVENLGVFVTETGAIEVARAGGYVLYSVPRR
ncbi:hypothetical protein LX81_00074 [Palleronia aestuarii]|uniref:Lipoprotein n=1 Tax=Palleronia aestuarii TaxID=568105 RepID=A0A2W7NHA0_9RHOB|nr:hypothetical protein [Palleronia aestuarii]PZX19618.1 hypothetical protein LX81_00074 [Palleronia aestuarii]